MDTYISSSVLPLVSGTSFVMNTIVRPQTLANTKNVPEPKQPLSDPALFPLLNNWNHKLEQRLTRRAPLCYEVEWICNNPRTEPVNKIHQAPAKPLACMGNIWNNGAMRCIKCFSTLVDVWGFKLSTSDIITQGIAPMPKANDPLNILSKHIIKNLFIHMVISDTQKVKRIGQVMLYLHYQDASKC